MAGRTITEKDGGELLVREWLDRDHAGCSSAPETVPEITTVTII
jgi:hypothetical protein